MNTDEIIADVREDLNWIAAHRLATAPNTILVPRSMWVPLAARLIIDDRKQKWKRICWALALANVLVWGWVAL